MTERHGMTPRGAARLQASCKETRTRSYGWAMKAATYAMTERARQPHSPLIMLVRIFIALPLLYGSALACKTSSIRRPLLRCSC